MDHSWSPVIPSRRVGNLIILTYLVVQGLDGILTYVGVTTFGAGIEANPLIRWLMGAVGEGPALAGAKLLAGSFGIVLHLIAVHRLVAVLTALHIGAAILPWTIILYFG